VLLAAVSFLIPAESVAQDGIAIEEIIVTARKRDACSTVNLRIGLEAENWSLTAWGRNLADERYLEEVIPAPEFGGSFLHQAAGVSYGLDLKYNF
jgi:outer membrane receptor protein involved in Fe transport